MTHLYRYNDFRVYPMAVIREEGRYSYIETVEDEKAQYWSIHGRTEEGEWETLANFKDKSSAVGMAALLALAPQVPWLPSFLNEVLPDVDNTYGPGDERLFQLTWAKLEAHYGVALKVWQAMKRAAELVADLKDVKPSKWP